MVDMEKKERCFKVIDDLIERGIDLFNLSKELNGNEYESFRKRLVRNFGSVKQAFIEYGIFDSNGIPTRLELHRCFYINDKYKVVTNGIEKHRIMDLYFLDEKTFRDLTKDIIYEVRLDALDQFYCNEFPENTKHTFIEKDEYKHLQRYLGYHYGMSMEKFLASYNTPSRIFVDRNYGGDTSDYIKCGYTFEILVEEVFKALKLNYKKQFSKEGCRPDFVVDGRWVDAKLHYKTVFHRSCKTLEKYSKHCSKLEIIYCFGEGSSNIGNGVRMTKITELYQELFEAGHTDLIHRIEKFIENNAHLYNSEVTLLDE